MNEKMTKRERIHAAILGQEVDQTPVFLWRPFHNRDFDPEQLARLTVEFQEQFDFDLVKLTPSTMYSAIDWGTVPHFYPGSDNPPAVESWGVEADKDWEKIEPLDVTQGRYGQELRGVSLVRQHLDPDTPFVQTLLSPMSVAMKLAGNFAIASARRGLPQLHDALDAICDTTVRFASKCMEAGADGFMYCILCASSDLLTRDEYREWGRQYDLRILDALAQMGATVFAHLHGRNLHFEDVLDYKIHVLNWHDRGTYPTLAEARKLTGVCLAGGIDQVDTLMNGTVAEVRAQAKDAVCQCGGKGLIVSSGCVVPPGCTEEKYKAVAEAVRSCKPGERFTVD